MQETQRSCFVGLSSASFFVVGVGIVVPAWIAFHVGGSRLVGVALLTSSVAGFVLAPLSGYIVDRCSRLTVTAAGQAIRAYGLLVLVLQVLPEGLSRPLLVLSAPLGAFGYVLLAGAMSGLL